MNKRRSVEGLITREGSLFTLLDAAVSAVTDFIYTFDLSVRFTYANPALRRLLQKEAGQMKAPSS